APEQAPRREHRTPKYAVLPDRLDRITRTAGLVLAAPGNRRRDEPLVDRDRSDRHGASGARKTRRACVARACVRRRSPRLSSAGCSSAASATSQSPALAISSVRDASTPASPSPSPSSAADALATTTPPPPAARLSGGRPGHPGPVLPGPQLRLGLRERLAQHPLDAIALDGASDLPRYRQAETRPLRGGVRERVQHQMPVGRRASLTVHPLELRAARQATATGRPRFHHATVSLKSRGACALCRGGA